MNNNDVLDLDALDPQKGADQGARLDLLHPATNAPTGAWLQLLGADSDAYRSLQRKLQRRRLAQLGKGRRITLAPEELEAEALDLLVTATTGWGGLVSGGKDLPFSQDAARALYTRQHWIQEQAQEFIGDRANFLPKSASSS